MGPYLHYRITTCLQKRSIIVQDEPDKTHKCVDVPREASKNVELVFKNLHFVHLIWYSERKDVFNWLKGPKTSVSLDFFALLPIVQNPKYR